MQLTILWDLDDEPGNVAHIAEHALPKKKWKTFCETRTTGPAKAAGRAVSRAYSAGLLPDCISWWYLNTWTTIR